MTVTTHNAVNTGNQPLLRRVASASAIGTAAEYYDFFAYGTAAVLFFGQLFFPSADPLISTLAAFATYAVGFLARPLGGIVFGHIGDKVGRKKALVITILIVGLGTFCIGLLPTYEQIGIWAPLALIFIRVLQGFGVGGEQAGAVLMTAEYAPPPQRGFYASWVQIGAPAGFLLPSGLFALLTAVAGLTLASLFSVNGFYGEWLAKFDIKVTYTWLGIAVAMAFTSIPFVVRTVQPVLEELGPEYEEAAETLGATRLQSFRKVVLPELSPALMAGVALSFTRSLGEFGAVIFIAGNIAWKTEVTSLMIFVRLQEFDYPAASAIASVILAASLLLLFAINTLQSRFGRRVVGH